MIISDGFTAKKDVAVSQALRRRRFFMAVATYAACAVLVQVCAWLGYLPSGLALRWVMGAVLVNLVFYVMLRSGWNLRLSDPSMTELQLFVSMAAVMVLLYYAGSARSAFRMLFPIPLLFGVLRLRLLQMVRVGLFGVVGYAGVIVLLELRQPNQVQLDLEMLNLLVLAGVMGFVCVMGGYLSRVRAELSKSIATINQMAQRDALTGVFNRRHLTTTLEREVARCARRRRCGLVLCMIDIDRFKRVNDTFGHQAGDTVLEAIAKRIGGSIRSVDYLARYGGEEFVVLLDMENGEDWLAVCERTRIKVSEMRLPVLQNQPVTISIGVAEYDSGETLSSFLGRADQALYQAKQEGRNCIRVAKGRSPRANATISPESETASPGRPTSLLPPTPPESGPSAGS